MHGSSRGLVLVGLVVAFVAASSMVLAQDEPPNPVVEAPEEISAEADDQLISINFQDVDLPTLVRFISDLTGRNFIVDEKVKGKITIISPSKISVDEAYNVFRSVLQVKGFTTVPSGSIIKILPVQEAKSATLETFLPDGIPPGVSDEYITQLMMLQNVDAANIMPIVQPLVSGNGLLAAYPPTNSLIIIDSAANIDRVGEIIHALDIEGFERKVEVLRLNYAFATELAGIIAQVLEDPAGSAASVSPGRPASRPRSSSRRSSSSRAPAAPATPPAASAGEGGTGEAAYKIIPDERTNTLIVVAAPPQMRRIKELVARLDVPLPLGTGRIHVYYLKYANAFEIVPVLSDLIGGGGAGGFSSGLVGRAITGSTAFRGGRLGMQGGANERVRRGGYGGGNLGGGIGGLGGFGSRGQSLGGSSRGSLGRGGRGGFGGFGGMGGGGGVTTASGGGEGEFEGEVRITADPSTNALIIYASPQDFQTLKRVIELLDVRRRQVFVEATILEVGVQRSLDLGIEMQGATSTSNGVALGRVNFGTINDAVLNPASVSGMLAAVASNQTVRLPDGTVVPAQQIILHAAQSDNDVNLLSAPTILTMDNQEAEIVVGQNVPFIGSRSTSETNLSNTFATIDRRDVGITLRITPQISEGGMVRLDIFEEVSRVIEESVAGLDPNLVGPTTTIRSATTSVVVRDGQTIVIGGLIADASVDAVAKVPFIAEIPVIGQFFRTTSANREKRNLLLFLTPHIVRTATEQRDLSAIKRDQVQAFMEEADVKNRQREFLDRPSWTPELPPEEDQDGEGTNGELEFETIESEDLEPRADGLNGDADTVKYAEGEQAPPIPTISRYVLLASFAERGSAPEGLKTDSGLLALSMLPESQLTSLFRKGGAYRFDTEPFGGLYYCLEAFTTRQEALLLYPEGLTVAPEQGEYLHWRQLQDASSANAASWTELD